VSDKPRSFERADEMRERGAMLPESANGVTSADFSARSPKHPGSGMECEQALFVGGEVLSEWEAYAKAIEVAPLDLEGFRTGWWKAMNGRYPWDCHGEAEKRGWQSYPRLRGYQRDAAGWSLSGTASATPSTDAVASEKRPADAAAD
jgi:hypothetical protein